MNCPTDIEKRVALSYTLRRYLHAVDQAERASRELTEACHAMRSALVEPTRFIAEIDYRHYLVRSDQGGDFAVEPIDLL